MVGTNVFALLALVSSALAITANFDDIGGRSTVGQYKQAGWPGFSECRGGSSGSMQVKPHSGQYYACSDTPESEGQGPSTAKLNLNVTSTAGHLSSFYFACFSTETFVAVNDACNFSVQLHCKNTQGAPVTLTYNNKYRPTQADGQKMEMVSLQPTYAAAAKNGVFAGDGSNAHCTSYTLTSRPTQQGGLKQAFFLDDAVYTLFQ